MPTQAEKQPFELHSLIAGVVQSFEGFVQEKNLSVSQNVTVADEVVGYADSVRQILTILYENAVKYTDEGGSVHVSAHRMKGSIVCSVKNTGRGISPQDLPRVFDRFYRADTARSDDGDGSFGLGLSIAQGMAAQIGGKITAQSEENGWTEFMFAFREVPLSL
jgi:signal transduction histidine kinase